MGKGFRKEQRAASTHIIFFLDRLKICERAEPHGRCLGHWIRSSVRRCSGTLILTLRAQQREDPKRAAASGGQTTPNGAVSAKRSSGMWLDDVKSGRGTRIVLGFEDCAKHCGCRLRFSGKSGSARCKPACFSLSEQPGKLQRPGGAGRYVEGTSICCSLSGGRSDLPGFCAAAVLSLT